jgi:hypothetical protein
MALANDAESTVDILLAKARIPSHVVHRAFPTETVLLNLSTGTYHGVNPTGGRMLEVLDEEPTVTRAAIRLAAEFEIPMTDIERDLRRFCGELLELGLIELEGPSAA